MKKRSLYFMGVDEVEVLEEPLETVGARDALVRAEVSAISAGTELLFVRGQVPRSMKVDESISSLSKSEAGFPMKYGYASVGRVVEVGTDVDPAWVGRRVFAFHPHASHFVSDVESLVVVPDDLSADSAALLPTMETALSLVMDARPVIGERVVVFGLGMVGLMVTRLLATMPLGRLIGVDPLALRRERALEIGADAAVDSAQEGVVDRVRAALLDSPEAPADADLALELSGNPSALDAAIRTVGFDGRVVVGSWYGTKPVALEALGEAFHRRHVEIRSSQVSRLDPRLTGRWNKHRRLGVALGLLSELDLGPFVTHRVPFEDASRAFALLRNHPEQALQVLLIHEEP